MRQVFAINIFIYSESVDTKRWCD